MSFRLTYSPPSFQGDQRAKGMLAQLNAGGPAKVAPPVETVRKADPRLLAAKEELARALTTHDVSVLPAAVAEARLTPPACLIR